MANELDELTSPVEAGGRDINVIQKQLPVKIGWGSVLFEVLLWVCGILPGIIFIFMKISAANYFRKLQQKLQAASRRLHNRQLHRTARNNSKKCGKPRRQSNRLG